MNLDDPVATALRVGRLLENAEVPYGLYGGRPLCFRFADRRLLVLAEALGESRQCRASSRPFTLTLSPRRLYVPVRGEGTGVASGRSVLTEARERVLAETRVERRSRRSAHAGKPRAVSAPARSVSAA